MQAQNRRVDWPQGAVAVTLLAGVMLPLGGAVLFRTVLPDWSLESSRAHTVSEAGGGFIALALAAVLLELRRNRSEQHYYVWIATALVAIAALDIGHALTAGQELWFESLTTALGGALFAGVWVPARLTPRARVLVPAVGGLSLFLVGVPLWWPDAMPVMATGGKFSGFAHALNGVGGAAFLAAAVRFLQRYRTTERWDDYLLAVLCALFGTAAFAFDDSMPWTAAWWWRHVLRVLAYGGLLLASIIEYAATHAQLRVEIDVREQAQSALRETEARFRAMVEAAADGIITFSDDGTVTSLNPAAEGMFLLRRGEGIGRQIEDLIPGGYAEHHAALVEGGLGAGRHATLRNIRGRRKDGTSFPMELSISEIDDSGSRIFSAFVRDLSERAALEEQLRQSQKMEAVGTLASGIAHDFNNLLMGITGCADVAHSGADQPRVVREQLAVIKQEAGKGAALTKQLLSFGRKREPVPATLHVDSVVAETESMLRNMLGEDIALDVELAGSDAHVVGDRGQLQQVLLNLAINARDAMPEGGTLSLRVEVLDANAAAVAGGRPAGLADPHVAVAVRDTGSGIDPEVLEHVFEPFFTTKEVGEGTGLGLAMVYGIVKRAGGWVDVHSEVGRGTTFTVYLPVVEPIERPSVPELAAHELRGNETVLVIEDEPAVRRSIVHYLGRWGYQALAARDGREALDLCRDPGAPVHLVLSDVVLPGMSGPEIARVLQVRRPELPVLFMSAYPEDKLVGDGRIPAGTATLQKPFSEGQLIEAVRRTVDGAHNKAGQGAKGPPQRAAGAERPTVLLVEDHAAARVAIGELLRDLGHRVLEADSGREALELCEAQDDQVDVVLTDIRLPDMPGPELVELVRERTGAGVVYMSGLSADEPVVREALAASRAAFIQKPADFDEIAECVARALEKSERQAEARAPQ